MFAFTKQEKMVVSLFIVVVLSGSILQYVYKKYPALGNMVNMTDGDMIYLKVDINTASFEDLVGVPYIGAYTADNIIRYRQRHGPFTAIEQIKNVKGIKEKNYAKFRRYIKI